MTFAWLIILLVSGGINGFAAIPPYLWLLLFPFMIQDGRDVYNYYVRKN